MVRSFLIFILICIFTAGKAQMEPQCSQNMFNLLSVNPGVAGYSGMLNVKGLFRQQYSGIEGAPRTTVVSADAAVQPFGINSGVGINLRNDEIGVISSLSMGVVYSYRIDLDDGVLSFGLDLGFMNQSITGSELSAKALDKKGVEVNTVGSGYHDSETFIDESGTVFDFGAGVFYETSKFYCGFSALHISEPKSKFDEVEFFVKRSLFLTGGYSFKSDKRPLVYKPSIFIKSDGITSQWDFNCNIEYKQRFFGGLTYRYQDGFVLLGGLELNNGLKVGYSIDIPTSRLAGYLSHELTLGYSLDLGIDKKNKSYKSVRYL